MDEVQKPFEQWALVELFGHQRIAGLVTEQTVGGCAFLRVDVPETKTAHATVSAFTKLFGNGAVYGITFVTEEIARAMAAGAYHVRPVTPFDLPRLPALLDAATAPIKTELKTEDPDDYNPDLPF